VIRSPHTTARTLELRPRPPFRLDLTVWALRRREQNAIDAWDGHTYRRALAIDEAPLQLAVTQRGGTDSPRLEVVIEGSSVGPSAEAAAQPVLERLLGLDLDLSSFYARAKRDGLLEELPERYGGLKPPRFPTLECLLNAVACRQLSIAAGLTILSRLAATAGESVGDLHSFPAPTDVLSLPRSTLRALGFSERKAETILDLAGPAAAGELERKTLEQLDDAAVIEALVRQRGIGRWSAHYVLLRALGRLHIFPASDVGALNGLRSFLAAGGRPEDPQAALVRWAPDAGIVCFHLLLRGLERRAGSRRADSGPLPI
jgi:DNA-3-methyladenine glycosylase II